MGDEVWPLDTVQGLSTIEPWWVSCPTDSIQRGQLVRAFIPFVDRSPYLLIAEGRASETDHKNVRFRIEDSKIRDVRRQRPALPVAALPHLPEGEAYAVYHAKIRPCLVMSTGGERVDRSERGSGPAYQTAPTLTVAPYFGVEPGSRGGWNPVLVERIRQAEYPQYMWDRLPIKGSAEGSILRLDHMQPIGRHMNSYEPLPWALSDDALALVGEWVRWAHTGRLSPKALLATLRGALRDA